MTKAAALEIGALMRAARAEAAGIGAVLDALLGGPGAQTGEQKLATRRSHDIAKPQRNRLASVL